MAKKAFVYDGTNWIDIAQSTTDLSNYANLTTTPISGFRNAIINGGFDVWQRGTSGIVPTPTQPYSADRWESYRGGYAAGLSVYRPAGPTGIQYAARVQRDAGNTSTANVVIGQPMETSNSIRFAGKAVVLSFFARSGANFSSTSSVLTAQINSGTGNDQNFRVGFTGNVAVASSGVTLTTSWQRFSITGTVSSSATQIGMQFFYTPVGTAGAADHFEITGVQLEEGSTATPFERRPIGTELALCQRYFQTSFNPGQVPAHNASGNGIAYHSGVSGGISGNLYTHLKFSPMRTFPVVSIFNGNNASATPANGILAGGLNASASGIRCYVAGGAGLDSSNIGIDYIRLESASLYAQGSFAGAVAGILAFGYVLNAEL